MFWEEAEASTGCLDLCFFVLYNLRQPPLVLGHEQLD